MSPRWRLILAVALFLGWMGWLGYAALTKSRGPVVSHAQAAAAVHAVVAEVEAGPDDKPGRAKVTELLTAAGPTAPPAGAEILVVNLRDAAGFTGPGPYLLYLTEMGPVGEGVPVPAYAVVGQQRSPGSDPGGPPLIYPWTDDVRKQAERLRR